MAQNVVGGLLLGCVLLVVNGQKRPRMELEWGLPKYGERVNNRERARVTLREDMNFLGVHGRRSQSPCAVRRRAEDFRSLPRV